MRILKNLYFLCLFSVPVLLSAQQIDREQLMGDLEYLASEELEGRKPLTPGHTKAQNMIRERFASLGLASQYPNFTQYFTFYNRSEKKAYEKVANIIGFVAGKEQEEIILVMAHYDHLGRRNGDVYLGADDNASGTAALLQIAAYFAEYRPNHSMIFAALDAEEMGLQGAKALLEDFPFPQSQIKLVINMDMVGRSVDNELFAVGTRHYPQLKEPLEKVVEESEITLTFGKDTPGTGRNDWTHASDHGPFHAEGIPFIYFGVEDHEDYHKPTDSFENIDQDFYYAAVSTILKAIQAFDQN